MSRVCANCGGPLRREQAKYCSRACALAARGLRAHGLSGHPLYKTWCGIKGRCYNPSDRAYKKHGGRGVRLYGPWVSDPAAFIAWVEENLGPRPKGCTLGRWPDSDGDYEPGNLRWAANGGRGWGAGGKLGTGGRSTATMIKCAGCGGRFVPTRSDAQYCSPTCRQRAYRARRTAS